MSNHLTITKNENGNDQFNWDWGKLENSVAKAVKTYEYSKLTKDQLEARGRELGIELDRRKKISKLVEQLIQFELAQKQ